MPPPHQKSYIKYVRYVNVALFAKPRFTAEQSVLSSLKIFWEAFSSCVKGDYTTMQQISIVFTEVILLAVYLSGLVCILFNRIQGIDGFP